MLHLYTPDRGRVGAVAKGVRRVKSRLGGRLEPLSRVRLVLHQGRGELCTVSQADTRARPRGAARAPRARSSAPRRPARRCCGCSTRPSPTRPPTTCSATSSRCSTRAPSAACRAQALAFRLKLLLAAGFAPELASCAACGEAEHLGALLAAAPAGSSARAARRARSRSARRPTASSSTALGQPARRGARGAGARALPGRPRDRRDARAPRPRAIEARRLGAYSRVPVNDRRRHASSSTTSPRARATCASCSAARAPTSPR